MSCGRKVLAALTAVAMSTAVALLLWPHGYAYQGRTVAAWFRDCVNDQWGKDYASTGEIRASGDAFRLMGTNAVPYLASRITRDFTPSRLERWLSKLPARFQPTPKEDEACVAALLINKCVMPPASMLCELLKPAMSSTNRTQLLAVQIALGECFCNPQPVASVPSTKNSTSSPVIAVITVLEPMGQRTVRMTNYEDVKGIEEWLKEVESTQLPEEQMGAVGPWCTVTLYEDPGGSTNAVSTKHIYAIDGRTTRRSLLTDNQRQRLINLINRK